MSSTPSEKERPSPEALLDQANREGRGKLKIFLGAAPGVGKTYEMLVQARARRLEGVDVVIGVVETHGRVETDALTKGFEVVPKKRGLYKGRLIAEMDLDAIIQRHPSLVLVDELAHTNAEGSRHPKRYMDVEEILAAGIDVYSTLNVQHIESLNDVVAKITRVQVRETVPDEILDEAAQIEVVDTTSDDLLKRLREGKVYVPEQAERALKNFFTTGNLTALRELALRRAAQRVDRDVIDYMQTHAISGPWPASEKILVCVNEHPSSAELIRRARRVSEELKVSWTALYVEGPRQRALSEVEKDRVADTLRLAQRLGAETLTVPGRNIAETILTYARKNNFTQILVTKSQRPWWFELIHGSVVRDLMRDGDTISITAVSLSGEAVPVKNVRTAIPQTSINWEHFGWSVAAIAVTIGAVYVFGKALTIGSAGMLFLVPVLISAVYFGLRAALFTTVVSVLSYNFFFLPPLYTFTIADPNNWLSFGVLLFVAVIAGNLASRVRAQADLAAGRAAVTGELYSFTGKLGSIARLDDILWASSFQISSMLKSHVVILLPDPTTKRPVIRAGYPPEDELDSQDLAAAVWSWDKGQPAGRNSETLPGAKRLFLPMRTGSGLVGIIGLQRPDDRTLYSPDERRLLDALIDQTSLAIERSQLVEKAEEAQVLAEADKLRIAMLTSLSHDLRTPLASILGAATTLVVDDGLYDRTQTTELLTTIREEAERLDRFVGNLLDMSRLEAGVVGAKRQVIDLEDVVESALKRLTRRLTGRAIRNTLPATLPLIVADPLLMEQALVNLLDNAVKYSGNDTPIQLATEVAPGRVTLIVEDEGQGIPEEELPLIFDKFYRAKASDRRIAGTGLGLAVARGFVEAFGGTLTARNRADRRGAAFAISVPMAPSSENSHGS
jgi:two-component system sensor histidine kinase KdpD